MSYSIAYNSGSTTPFGTFKQGTITMGLKPQEYTVSSGFTWYANAETPNDNYLIISDTYSQGWSNQAESKPTIWRSETGTTESFVSLVNQLPDVNGVTGFTDSGTAMKYLMDSGKYFVNKDDYLGIVSDGLILNLDAGWYPSYSGSGTTWKGIKGTNNGTLINGPTFNSANGGSIVFDGVDDYGVIQHSDMDYDRSCFSVEGWIKATNYHNNYDGQLFSKWNTGGGSSNEFVITIGSGPSGPGAGVFAVQDPSDTGGDNGRGSYSVSALSTYIPGEWYHIVGTFDNGVLRYFRNGVLQSERDAGFTTVKTQISVPFKIASFNESNGTYSFDGSIGCVRMYSGKSLTVDEVLQNYNATKGRFGL